MMPDAHGGPAGAGPAYMDSYGGGVGERPGKSTGSSGRDGKGAKRRRRKAVTVDGPEGGTMLHAQAEGYENAPPGRDTVKAATVPAGPPGGALAAALTQHRAAAAKLMNWAASCQPSPVAAGHAAQPAVNAPVPRGDLAAGHPTVRDAGTFDRNDPGHLDQHLATGVTGPAQAVPLSATCAAPPASSYWHHPGTATVGIMDARSAASPDLGGQLAANPAGMAGAARADWQGTAPQGRDYRVNSVRPGGAPSLTATLYSGRSTPYGVMPRVNAPGAAFSCGSPGVQR